MEDLFMKNKQTNLELNNDQVKEKNSICGYESKEWKWNAISIDESWNGNLNAITIDESWNGKSKPISFMEIDDKQEKVVSMSVENTIMQKNLEKEIKDNHTKRDTSMLNSGLQPINNIHQGSPIQGNKNGTPSQSLNNSFVPAKVMNQSSVSSRNGCFYYADNSLWKVTEKAVPKAITNFSVQILSLTQQNIETANERKIFFLYEVLINIAGVKYSARIGSDQIEEISSYKAHTAGLVQVYKKCSDDFKEYIHALMSERNYPAITSYDTCGWKIVKGSHENSVINGFLLPSGIVGNKSYPIQYSGNRVFVHKTVYRNKDFFDYLGMLEIAPLKITVPLLLWTNVAVMGKLFEEAKFPIKFLIALIGITNSRKTSLATCLCQLFDREQLKPEISFESTLGGLEEAMKKYPSEVLVIDDLRPGRMPAETRLYHQKLDFVARAVGDRIQKQRMTYFSANQGELACPILTFPLVTGEILSGTASTMARIVELQINQSEVDNDKLSYYQNNYQILQDYIYQFVAFIAKNYDGVLNKIKSQAFVIRKGEEKNFSLPRYAEYFAILSLTAETILDFAQYKGFLDVQAADDWKYRFVTVIREVLQENDTKTITDNLSVMILRVINEKVYSNAENVIQLNQVESGHIDSIGKFVFVDDDHIYIRLEVMMKMCKEYYSSYKKYLALATEHEFINYLKAVDAIKTVNEGERERNTIKVKELGNKRVLCIKKAVMRALVEDAENI